VSAPFELHRPRPSQSRIRVCGFDPGTITTDLCALEDGRLIHAGSLRTAVLAADPGALVEAARAGARRFAASLS